MNDKKPGVLLIVAQDGSRYRHEGVSDVREARRELRWTSPCGERSQMPLPLIRSWNMNPPPCPECQVEMAEFDGEGFLACDRCGIRSLIGDPR